MIPKSQATAFIANNELDYKKKLKFLEDHAQIYRIMLDPVYSISEIEWEFVDKSHILLFSRKNVSHHWRIC